MSVSTLRGFLGFAALVSAAETSAQAPQVQLGVRTTPDTVTVGERFIAVVRIRAPLGSIVEFPTSQPNDLPPTATALIGEPAIEPLADSLAVMVSAAYRLAAWNTGTQPLGIGEVRVIRGGDTTLIPLSRFTVHVRSVLPADSSLHVPRPPRPAITITAFDWMQLLIALLVLAAFAALWRFWTWYRGRRQPPADPYGAALREFGRIEGMELVAAGALERHAALMIGVTRRYLTARVPGVMRSHTSSEIVAAAAEVRGATGGLGELLWLSDLIRFARHAVSEEEAHSAGADARRIVDAVEALLTQRERAAAEKVAEKAA